MDYWRPLNPMAPPQLSEDELDKAFDEIVAAVGAADRDRAIALATVAVGQGLDEEPLVLILAAEGLVFDGRAAEALPLLKKAAELGPEEAEVWRRYGDALSITGAFPAALTALQTSLRLAPDLVPALISAAGAGLRLGQIDLAEGYLRRAEDLAPQLAEPKAGLAAIAALRDKPAEAPVRSWGFGFRVSQGQPSPAAYNPAKPFEK
jgi:tetratricopeptide (TPR) repeat protein